MLEAKVRVVALQRKLDQKEVRATVMVRVSVTFWVRSEGRST